MNVARLVEAVTRDKLRRLGKPLDHTSHVPALMLGKSKLSFTWFPSAISGKYSGTIWRSTSDGVHFEHFGTESVPDRNVNHPMVS